MRYLLLGVVFVIIISGCSTRREMELEIENKPIENLSAIINKEGKVVVTWDSVPGNDEYMVGFGLMFDSVWNAAKNDPLLMTQLPSLDELDQHGGVATVVNDTSLSISSYFPNQEYDIQVYGYVANSNIPNSSGVVRILTDGATTRIKGQWEVVNGPDTYAGWKFNEHGGCIYYTTNKKLGVDYLWQGKSQNYIIGDDGDTIFLYAEGDPDRQQFSYSLNEDQSLLAIDNVVYKKI